MARARPTTAAGEAYAGASLPSGRDDWRAARLGGRRPRDDRARTCAADEIISIAVVPIDGGRVRPGDALYSLVRPERPPTAESIRIHGIRPADLEVAPRLDEILDDVLQALTGRLLVAHAAFVERGFLEPVLATQGPAAARRRHRHAAARADLARRARPRDEATAAGTGRAGRDARPAGAPPAPRARRCADDGPGVPRARESSRASGRVVGEDDGGAAEAGAVTRHQLC